VKQHLRRDHAMPIYFIVCYEELQTEQTLDCMVDSVIRQGLQRIAEGRFDELSSSVPSPSQPGQMTATDTSPQSSDEPTNAASDPTLTAPPQSLSFNETLPELIMDPSLDQTMATGDFGQFLNVDPIRV
jgi:hypothetical protein